jgi:hypothetical protein
MSTLNASVYGNAASYYGQNNGTSPPGGSHNVNAFQGNTSAAYTGSGPGLNQRTLGYYTKITSANRLTANTALAVARIGPMHAAIPISSLTFVPYAA